MNSLVRHNPKRRVGLPSKFCTSIATVLLGLVFLPQQIFTQENGIFGTWHATDAKTRSIKKIELIKTDQTPIVKLWFVQGKDLSPRLFELPAAERNLVKGPIKFSKDYGFKKAYYIIHVEKNRLELKTNTMFTDKSARKDYQTTASFDRETGVGSKVSKQKNPAGWDGFWRNLDRKSGGTLQLEIIDSAETTMRVWAQQGGAISDKPISETPLNLAENKATGQVDHKFCFITYSLVRQSNGQIKLKVETDYTDPKRKDQEYIWLFERGKY